MCPNCLLVRVSTTPLIATQSVISDVRVLCAHAKTLGEALRFRHATVRRWLVWPFALVFVVTVGVVVIIAIRQRDMSDGRNGLARAATTRGVVLLGLVGLGPLGSTPGIGFGLGLAVLVFTLVDVRVVGAFLELVQVLGPGTSHRLLGFGRGRRCEAE
jgi:hypothetical protein